MKTPLKLAAPAANIEIAPFAAFFAARAQIKPAD
jgi:hypothetical protein